MMIFKLRDSMILLLCSAFTCVAPLRAQDFWQPSVGPKNMTVNFITESPANILFLGSQQHGLYQSSDDGLTWQHTGSGLGYGEFFNSLVWSNNAMFTADDSYGIYQSTDGGLNFGKFSQPGSDAVQKLYSQGPYLLAFAGYVWGYGVYSENGAPVEEWKELSASLQDMLWMVRAPDNSLYSKTFDDGSKPSALFHSTDNGTTWTKIYAQEVTGFTTDHSGNTIYVTATTGIAWSTNSGKNWTQGASIPAVSVNAMFATDNGRVILTALNGNFLSTDRGATWTGSALDSNAIQTFFLDSKGTLFAGGADGVFRSLDTGITWSPINSGWPPVPISSLTASATATLLAGTSAGNLFRTTNAGASWKHITDLAITSLNALSTDPSPVIVAGEATGIIRSTDGGFTWSGANGVSKATHAFAWTDAAHAFAATAGGVYSSADSGNTWSVDALDSVALVAIANNSSGIFAAGSAHAVYVSTNGGGAWTKTGLGIPARSTIAAVAVDGGGNIFAGCDSGMFQLKSDGTWQATSLGSHAVRAIAVDAHSNIYAGTADGVYRLSNGENAWTLLTLGATKIVANGFTFDPAGYLYTATNGGMYRSQLRTLVKAAAVPPQNFSIASIAPNPFHENTMIHFTIAQAGNAELRIMDALGRTLATPLSGYLNSGAYEIPFANNNLPAGIYFCTLRRGDAMQTKILNIER